MVKHHIQTEIIQVRAEKKNQSQINKCKFVKIKPICLFLKRCRFPGRFVPQKQPNRHAWSFVCVHIQNLPILTARGRLCFHRCVSVQGEGGTLVHWSLVYGSRSNCRGRGTTLSGHRPFWGAGYPSLWSQVLYPASGLRSFLGDPSLWSQVLSSGVPQLGARKRLGYPHTRQGQATPRAICLLRFSAGGLPSS